MSLLKDRMKCKPSKSAFAKALDQKSSKPDGSFSMESKDEFGEDKEENDSDVEENIFDTERYWKY